MMYSNDNLKNVKKFYLDQKYRVIKTTDHNYLHNRDNNIDDYKSWTSLEKVSKKNSKRITECFIDISKEITRDISKSIV